MKAMLRRDFRLFRRGFIPALVLTLLLAMASAMAGYSVLSGAREKKAPVQVALVDEEGSAVSRFCINLVSSQSYIASLIDVSRVSRSRALKGIDDGSYAAVIILPDGYTDNIMVGRRAEGEIILSRAAAASAEIVASVADFGERLLLAGQNGVFAGEDVADALNLSDDAYYDFLDRSNTELLETGLTLYDNGTEDRLTAYSGTGLGTEQYYAVTWTALFLLVAGLFFSQLYTADHSKPLLIRLFSHGISPLQFLAGKWLWPFLFRLPLAAALIWGLSRLMPLSVSPVSLLLAVAGTVLSTAMISFSAAALAARKGWGGLLLGISALGLFLTGGIIPRSMLPQALTAVGDLSPSGAAAAYLSPLFGGSCRPLPLCMGFLYAAAAFFFAVRHIRRLPEKGEEL